MPDGLAKHWLKPAPDKAFSGGARRYPKQLSQEGDVRPNAFSASFGEKFGADFPI
jgi:hypothetical protein